MATVNELVETILDNIEGTKPGDLDLRARMLREAGYLPTGKRGGGRGLAHVNSEHCANMIIGLLASSSARGVVPLVKHFRELPLLATTAVDIVGMTVVENMPEPKTLLLVIQGMIDNWRAEVRPWSADVNLEDMIGFCDRAEGPVVFSFRDLEGDEDGRAASWWLVYGDRPDFVQAPRWSPMLSLSGAVIGHIVKLLGPVEGAGA